MTWKEFNDGTYERLTRYVETDISCPRCEQRKIYLDRQTVFRTTPVQYRYACKCGWEGSSFIKWRAKDE